MATPKKKVNRTFSGDKILPMPRRRSGGTVGWPKKRGTVGGGTPRKKK